MLPTGSLRSLVCPTNVCILCYGVSRGSPSYPPPHQFPAKRLDSLRRHLIESHFALVRDGISCNWSSCRDVPKCEEITGFLAHAVNVHAYDVHIKLQNLPKKPAPIGSDTSSIGSAEGFESGSVSCTELFLLLSTQRRRTSICASWNPKTLLSRDPRLDDQKDCD